jgi:hypothetical protein
MDSIDFRLSNVEKCAKKFKRKKAKKTIDNLSTNESETKTQSSSILVKDYFSSQKTRSTKSLFYLHYLKKLCELASCHSTSHTLSPKQINKTTSETVIAPLIKKRAKSVSSPSENSYEDSDNYATLFIHTRKMYDDKFWQNDKVKPIIKLAEDFEYYTDDDGDTEKQDSVFEHKCDDSIMKNETNLKAKNFNFRHLNCFMKRNGSLFFKSDKMCEFGYFCLK